MLKNWTVVTESAKCVIARERYLNDKQHKNHINTEQIINIYGSENQSLNMLRNCERYKLAIAKKRRGGRPPTAAIEFVFSLPKSICPSSDEWRLILNIVINNLSDSLNIESRKLASIVRAVVHRQNQNTKIKGSGDHMHVLVGKFTDDLTYLRNLQRKSTTRLMKQSFNFAMLDVMGISHQSYQLDKDYIGEAKKRAPTWKVKSARKADQISEQKKRLKRIISQAKKWLEAYEVNNVKQMNRQYNRLNKELDELGLDSAGEQDQAMSELISNLLLDIDSKKKKSENVKKLKNKFALGNL